MAFNSLPFIGFFGVILLLHFLLPTKGRWILLLSASVLFYLLFVPAYLLVVATIIAIDYVVAIKLESPVNGRRLKFYYLVAIITNVAILVFFKYFNFLNTNITVLLSLVQIKNPIPYLEFILPLGISFSTFQSVGYLADVRSGKIKAERHLGYYSLFILFFPHIGSGPIARASHLMPQIHLAQTAQRSDLAAGFSQALLGFFKKVVVGDLLGNYVDVFYRSYEQFSGFAILFACWIFLFQLYADFSGYTDIATGCARMLGYRLHINFSLPLFSKTMTELWRRWHISLSTWLRDYLFTPMAIAYRDWGIYSVVFSQLVTFAICGLWHGAGWQFIIYGLIHGVYLVSEFLLKIRSSFYNKNFFRKCLGVFITFNLLSLSLIFFRSPGFTKVNSMFQGIFTRFLPVKVRIFDPAFFVAMVGVLAVLLAIEYFLLRDLSFDSLYQKMPKTLLAVNLLLLILIVLFGVSSSTQFIYYQF